MTQPKMKIRPADCAAQEMAEEIRRRFGHDMRHPAQVRWLAECIREARHEAAIALGLSDAPRPAPCDVWGA